MESKKTEAFENAINAVAALKENGTGMHDGKSEYYLAAKKACTEYAEAFGISYEKACMIVMELFV